MHYVTTVWLKLSELFVLYVAIWKSVVLHVIFTAIVCDSIEYSGF